MKNLITWTCLMLLLQSLIAQDPFVTTYENGEITGIATKDNGNFMIVGMESHYGPDVYLAEIDGTGAIQWSRRLESQLYADVPRGGFIRTANNTYLTLCNAFQEHNGAYRHFIYNFNADGSTRWTTEIDTAGAFMLKNVFELDTNYVLIGEKEGNVRIQYLSDDGELQNRITYPSAENVIIKKTAKSPEALCMVGNFEHDDRRRNSIYVLSVDHAGNKLWEKRLNSSHSNMAHDVIYKDGLWYLAGYTHQGTTNDKSQPIFYKLDAAGNTVAVDSFLLGNNQTTFPFNMAESPDGNILVNGTIAKVNPPNVSSGGHFFMCKITPDLQLLWSNIIEADCEPCDNFTRFWPHTLNVFGDFTLSTGRFVTSPGWEKLLIRTRLDGTVPVVEPPLADAVQLHVWPNPARDRVWVQLRGEELELGRYEVRLCQGGRLVRREMVFGNREFEISLIGLVSGVYDLTLHDLRKRMIGRKRILVP